MSRTIVNPSLAPIGLEPKFLGIEFIEPTYHGNERYRTEAWQLNNGSVVVIVSDNHGMSLMNASVSIATAIHERWDSIARGQSLTIIEDWTADPEFQYDGDTRFVISAEDGGNRPLDFDMWDKSGIVLPR